MIISICSTYLCKKGCMDEAVCMAGLIFGFFEILAELAFAASLLGVK